MTEPQPTKWTAHSLEMLLRAKHAAPSWAYLTNVADATGSARGRYCDGLAMGLWPSIGLELHGYEIKVSRGDWTREMQDHSKGETFAQYCDYWWVAAPAGVVKVEELPATWGLVEPLGDATRVRKMATKNRKPKPIGRNFLAALLRRVVEQSPAEHLLEAAVRKAKEEGLALGHSRTSDSNHLEQLTRLAEVVRQFEEASGIKLTSYADGKNLGELVHRLRRQENALGLSRADITDAINRLERGKRHLENLLAEEKPTT